MLIFSYSYVIEKQPIGKLLFQEFCQSNSDYGTACNFLNKVSLCHENIKLFSQKSEFFRKELGSETNKYDAGSEMCFKKVLRSMNMKRTMTMLKQESA